MKLYDLMGNKAKARKIMKASDVPVVPGYEGEIRDVRTCFRVC